MIKLLTNKHRIPLNDGWWIEGSKAWFITCAESELYEVDINEKKYRYLDTIPEENIGWRMNPTCFKHGDDIYCLPDTGGFIWIYNLQKKNWISSSIENKDMIRLGLTFIKCEDSFAYLYSSGKRAILKLDLNEGSISNTLYFDVEEQELLGRPFFNNEELFLSSLKRSRVYKMSIKTGKQNDYLIPMSDMWYNIACYFEDKLFLAGFDKNIYVYNINSGEFIKMSLPRGFGEYRFGERDFTDSIEVLDTVRDKYEDPAFLNGIVINNRIWFVPLYSNQVIYVCEDEKLPHVFEIEHEEETVRSVKNRILPSKYFLQYVRENRFIGLFSVKNEWLVEIDTETMGQTIVDMKPDDDTIEHIKSRSYKLLNKENDSMGLAWFIDELIWPKYKLRSDYKQ